MSERAGLRPTTRPTAKRRAPGLTVCRLSVPLPRGPWVQAFTTRHPEVLLEVVERLDLGRARVMMGVRVRSVTPGDWAREIRSLPGVVTVEELGPRGSLSQLRVVHRTSAFLPVFRTLQLQQRFPFSIQAGVATWVIMGSSAKVRRLLSLVRRLSPGLSVVSVTHNAAPGRGPLTTRQAAVFRHAMSRGYFEVPRGVSLTELAREIGRAKSSLSETLAVIERKLLVGAHESGLGP